jgi:predicted flap endonuclease-1-like 5' DNA nuclease
MASKTVVLAYFNDEVAADDAVESLKAWDKADKDVSLNAIGVLVLDDKGKIKTHKLGKRSVGKGAGIGLLLALITPAGLGLAVAGGVLGALHHKGLNMSGGARDDVQAQLAGGKAAVGVLVKEDQAAAVAAKLAELGGTTQTIEVPEEVEAAVEEQIPAVEAAEAAAGDDLTIIDGVGPASAAALSAAGVTTFAGLAEKTPEEITDILAQGNASLIAGHTTDTWPRQAKLAAAGDWSALRRYVDSKK